MTRNTALIRALSAALFATLTLSTAMTAHAQTPVPAGPPIPQYGTTINLEVAHKLLGVAIAESRKQNFPMAVAIVDNAGQLVAFERMDNTQSASTLVAQDKAVSAALYRRPTKVFQDLVAGGGIGLRVLTLRGANAVEGGLPIVVDGKVIGGIGVSGAASDQDGYIAKTALDSLTAK